VDPIAESPKRIIADRLSSSPPSTANGLPYTHNTASTPSFLNTDPSQIPPLPIPPKKKGSRWRRASPTRKPSGLASAIASTGLAMANPGVQVSVPVLVPVTKPDPKEKKAVQISPRRGSKSNVRKARPARTSTGSLEIPSPQHTRHRRRRRPSQSSVQQGSEGGDEDDDRSVIEGDDSDQGSDSSADFSDDDDEDLALLEDDIPVTGFAVASNKRNADFHELFKTIPEGDYLIEGESFRIYL
jgi:hypothetical protein